MEATQQQVVQFILKQFRELKASEFEMTVDNGEKTMVIAVAVTSLEPSIKESK